MCSGPEGLNSPILGYADHPGDFEKDIVVENFDLVYKMAGGTGIEVILRLPIRVRRVCDVARLHQA